MPTAGSRHAAAARSSSPAARIARTEKPPKSGAFFVWTEMNYWKLKVVQKQSDRRTPRNGSMFRVPRFKVQVFNLEPRTLNIEPPLGTTAARWLFFNNRLNHQLNSRVIMNEYPFRARSQKYFSRVKSPPRER